MGFIIHFYTIFGTNLLTGGPVQIGVFLPILVFQRKGIPNGVQTEWNFTEIIFEKYKKILERKDIGEEPRGIHMDRGRPTP